MNVLAVDDSPSLLGILVENLKDFGHTVVEAPNGAVAASKLEKQNFDLIISDLNMLVLGGLELLTIVRQDQNHQSCPFILLTTELDPTLKAEARQLGATAWMNKPFDTQKLRKLVSSFEPH